MGDRLRIHEIPSLRLSMAAAGKLPPDQVERLIDEVEALLRERDQLVGVLEEMRGPWSELRRLMAELHGGVSR